MGHTLLTNLTRHCVGGSGEEEEHSCERVDRDYNIRLRVGLLFVMLVTSSIGVFTPILVASYVSPSHPIFTVLRQFGTGVIISTAFVHVSNYPTVYHNNATKPPTTLFWLAWY